MSSEEILERVIGAREIQEKQDSYKCWHDRLIRKFCKVDEPSSALLEKAMDRFGLSARAHARILKISRTIADLENKPDVESFHIAEAIQYRMLDRKMMQ